MSIRATFVDGSVVDVDGAVVDLLRIEKVYGESWHVYRRRGFVGALYRLGWLALQREGHPAVAPHVDLYGLTVEMLDRGAELLAEVATVDVGE